jgi:hypothetical protein
VNITSFLRTLVSGVSNATVSDSTESVTMSGDVDIAFDEKMARLAMENAKTNALAHGSGGPIEIGAKLQAQGGAFHLLLSEHNSSNPQFTPCWFHPMQMAMLHAQ